MSSYRYAFLLFMVAMNWGCSYTSAPIGEQEKFYDFDNKVHYYQTRLSKKRYRLEVVEDGYQQFANQSAFLLRHSAQLCNDSTFSLRITQGVQDYERFPTHPRGYEPNLVAELICE